MIEHLEVFRSGFYSEFRILFSNFFARYHYNVIDARLHQHIEKAAEDGLYLSCVASASNLWALIMDAGTGFSDQVYELSSAFLHKVSSCWQGISCPDFV